MRMQGAKERAFPVVRGVGASDLFYGVGGLFV